MLPHLAYRYRCGAAKLHEVVPCPCTMIWGTCAPAPCASWGFSCEPLSNAFDGVGSEAGLMTHLLVCMNCVYESCMMYPLLYVLPAVSQRPYAEIWRVQNAHARSAFQFVTQRSQVRMPREMWLHRPQGAAVRFCARDVLVHCQLSVSLPAYPCCLRP